MRRVAGGDRAAFRQLMERHQRPIAAYAQRMLGDVSLAEDVAQETFLRLWSRAGRFRPESARLTTWLHNIAHNLCIDRYRSASRSGLVAEPGEPVDSRADPETLHGAAQAGDRVREALAQLPERQRSALLLCHYQGLSNRDAAQVLDVSVDALESLLARARRALRKQLELEHAQ